MRKNLILLHGALGSKEQMAAVGEHLASNYQTWSFDFEGHGKNKGEQNFSMELFVKNTLDFMRDNKIENSHFFGYSMGGYVALKLALLYPEKVKKIFCLGTKFAWNPTTAQKEVSKLQTDLIEKKVPQFAARLKKRHMDWKAVMSKTAQMMLELGESKALKIADFSKINNEVLLAVGEKDNMVSIGETEEIAKALPNGTHILASNLPHAIEQLEIEKLSALLHSFFAKNP